MSLPRARPGRRLLAFLLDYLVITVYIVVLTLVTQGAMLAGVPVTDMFANPIRADLFAFILLILPVMLYFALSESGPRRATWGKSRLHLCVTDGGGRRLTFPRALLRSAVKFLPWQIAHTSLFQIPGWPLNATTIPTGSVIGFILVWLLIFVYLGFLLFHPARRTPYDFAAGSMVIDSTPVDSTAVASTATARPS